MTQEEKVDEQLKKYGLSPNPVYAEEIRNSLLEETNNKAREDNELLKLYCIQLFSIGNIEDSLLIWKAKESSFDAHFYIDIQLVCGAVLAETKKFLSARNTPNANNLLEYLIICEGGGDFDDFSVESKIEEYRYYFYGSS
jgi:hypothetical protein